MTCERVWGRVLFGGRLAARSVGLAVGDGDWRGVGGAGCLAGWGAGANSVAVKMRGFDLGPGEDCVP